MNQEEEVHLSWPYYFLVCERVGDDYEAMFWLRQAAARIGEDRRSFIGPEGYRDRRPGMWEYVLALDLLKQEIDMLRMMKEER
jgi:hypothetical protein